MVSKRGGARPGAGRPAIPDTRRVRITISLPRDIADQLARVPRGKRSAAVEGAFRDRDALLQIVAQIVACWERDPKRMKDIIDAARAAITHR